MAGNSTCWFSYHLDHRKVHHDFFPNFPRVFLFFPGQFSLSGGDIPILCTQIQPAKGLRLRHVPGGIMEWKNEDRYNIYIYIFNYIYLFIDLFIYLFYLFIHIYIYIHIFMYNNNWVYSSNPTSFTTIEIYTPIIMALTSWIFMGILTITGKKRSESTRIDFRPRVIWLRDEVFLGGANQRWLLGTSSGSEKKNMLFDHAWTRPAIQYPSFEIQKLENKKHWSGYHGSRTWLVAKILYVAYGHHFIGVSVHYVIMCSSFRAV